MSRELLTFRGLDSDLLQRSSPVHNGSVPVDLPLATAITVCLAGVMGIGVYAGPWVAAAQRIAQTLF